MAFEDVILKLITPPIEAIIRWRTRRHPHTPDCQHRHIDDQPNSHDPK